MTHHGQVVETDGKLREKIWVNSWRMLINLPSHKDLTFNCVCIVFIYVIKTQFLTCSTQEWNICKEYEPLEKIPNGHRLRRQRKLSKVTFTMAIHTGISVWRAVRFTILQVEQIIYFHILYIQTTFHLLLFSSSIIFDAVFHEEHRIHSVSNTAS